MLERAAALLERSFALRAGDAQTLSALAQLRGRKEQPDQARRLFESAIELAPKDPIPRLDYARYLLGTADGAPPAVAGKAIANARVHLRVARELRPDRPEPYALFGMTYILDMDSAPLPGIRALVRAAELLPRDGLIYYFMAKLLVRSGQVEQARKFLQIVLRPAQAEDIVAEARELLRALEQDDS